VAGEVGEQRDRGDGSTIGERWRGRARARSERLLSGQRWLWARRENDPAYIPRLYSSVRRARNGNLTPHIFVGYMSYQQ
jgi:hypothetical protein